MQKYFQDKRAVLLIAIMALASLIMLAGSLQEMDFRPANSMGGLPRSGAVEFLNIGKLVFQAAQVPFWTQLTFWIISFLVVLLIASLLNPELRKGLIYAFLRMAIFALGFFYLIKRYPKFFAGLFNSLSSSESPVANLQSVEVTEPQFVPPQVPNWFPYIVSFSLVVLVGLFLWWLNRVWLRIRELAAVHDPLGEIAKIARTSLNDLKSGHDLEDSIVECYARMSSVVDERIGLQRENAMTPSEFAARLWSAGLPREPVAKLTQLFESVRYGGRGAGQAEINDAICSLKTILRYCGEEA